MAAALPAEEDSLVSALIEWFASAGAPRQRPDPAVQITTRAAIPAWVLRVAAAAAMVLVGCAVAPGVPTLVVAACLAVAVAIAPHGAVPALAVLLTALELLRRPADASTMVGLPAPVTTAVVLCGLHLMVHLCRRVADLSPGAAVEWAALRRGAVPALVAQAVAQMAALVALLVAAPEASVPWVAVPVLAGVVALIAVAGRALHRAEQTEQARRSRADAGVEDGAPVRLPLPRWGKLDD
ncbi:hypothetical protein [Ruania halotolerans]|uniref:hypothetical protein n=1 Tax=Ruania halotolerans TaxID=2897773 RepID=UPI001E369E21|nr:hypothetical protein [Ruania halotolerans]UFU05552.1 hypothetical protein LQF10_14000 [Ruania halotolerans]